MTKLEIALQITLKAIEEKAVFDYKTHYADKNESVLNHADEVNTFFNAVLENLNAQKED